MLSGPYPPPPPPKKKAKNKHTIGLSKKEVPMLSAEIGPGPLGMDALWPRSPRIEAVLAALLT